jgi:hypothetical protein
VQQRQHPHLPRRLRHLPLHKHLQQGLKQRQLLEGVSKRTRSGWCRAREGSSTCGHLPPMPPPRTPPPFPPQAPLPGASPTTPTAGILRSSWPQWRCQRRRLLPLCAASSRLGGGPAQEQQQEAGPAVVAMPPAVTPTPTTQAAATCCWLPSTYCFIP